MSILQSFPPHRPFAVNLPLQYPAIDEHVKICLEKKVPIVFTSAGNPKLYTGRFKEAGITVVHVVGSSAFAVKAQNAGVDAVVAEGDDNDETSVPNTK